MSRLSLFLLPLVIATLVASGCGFKKHDVALPAIAASDDAELIARGEYLFHGAAHCTACHNTKEVGIGLKGGDRPLPLGGGEWKMGPLGTIRSPNLTPDIETGIGGMSDGELARVLRHTVNREGTISPFMRLALGRFADDDIQALISYMRTLPPTRNEVKKTEVGILAGPLLGGIPPREAFLDKAPPLAATVERGKYLAEGPAMCIGCHSVLDLGSGNVKPGTEFAGAEEPMPSEFEDDPNKFMAPNLTTDKATGIAGRWTEEQFLARFAAGRVHRGSPMPWGNYQNLQPDDVKALWMFLQTLPPVARDTGDTVRPK